MCVTNQKFSVVYQGKTVAFTADEVREMFEFETGRKFDDSEKRAWSSRIQTWMTIKSNQPNIAGRILKWREVTAEPAPARERRMTLQEQLSG